MPDESHSSNRRRILNGRKDRLAERAAAMFAVYESGKSLAEVGKQFGCTRQTVYAAFAARGFALRPQRRFGSENHFYRGIRGKSKKITHAVEKFVHRRAKSAASSRNWRAITTTTRKCLMSDTLASEQSSQGDQVMRPLLLSVFPGVDLLGHAFELEWPESCVVRGPDLIFGSLSDIRTFHPPAGVFHGVFGGSPCQTFSALSHLVRANGYEPRFGNLIPEFERCVAEAQPEFFLMENVPAAPTPIVPGYGTKSLLLDNSRLAVEGSVWGQEQRRVRRITFGMRGRADADVPSLMRWIDLAVWVLPDAEQGVYGHGETPSQRSRKNAVHGPGEPPSQRVGAATAGYGDETLTAGHRERERRKAVTSNVGGTGIKPGTRNNGKGRYRLADAIRLQGLPPDFLADAPFTADGKLKAIANGVPIAMGRALARAVQEALKFAPGGASRVLSDDL